MYEFILDDMLLPVAPAKLTIKVGNKNKTVDLVSIGEANILKDSGLKDFSFEILLPAMAYPFVSIKEGFKEPFFYLEKLQKLKELKKPFSFEVLRLLPNGAQLLSVTETVSIEDFSYKEEAGGEGDFWVTLTLREYRLPITKIIKPVGVNEETGQTQITETEQREAKETAKSYTVVAGDNLWNIAKRELNDGSRYGEIAELNNIKNPDLIYPGQVLKLP